MQNLRFKCASGSLSNWGGEELGLFAGGIHKK